MVGGLIDVLNRGWSVPFGFAVGELLDGATSSTIRRNATVLFASMIGVSEIRNRDVSVK